MRTVDRIKEIISAEEKLLPLYEEIRDTSSHPHSKEDIGKLIQEKKAGLGMLRHILDNSKKCPSVVKKGI